MSLTFDQIMNELADYKALDQLLCCSGMEGCGCQGVTLREEIAHRLAYVQSQEPEWEEALVELALCDWFGALNDQAVTNIARNHGVDKAELWRRFREE